MCGRDRIKLFLGGELFEGLSASVTRDILGGGAFGWELEFAVVVWESKSQCSSFDGGSFQGGLVRA